MSSKFKQFKQKFIKNFIMPRDLKNVVLEKNLKLLLKVSVALTILCFVMFVVSLLRPNSKGVIDIDYVFYYFAMAVLSLFTTVVSYCFLKIKKIKKSLYNIPLIVHFIGLEVICFVTYTYGSNSFNLLISFVCIATITLLAFAIEPLYYTVIIIITGIFMSQKIYDLYGMDSVQNGFVYLLLMCSLSMSRWFSIKSNMEHDYKTKEREKQIKQELEMAALVQKSFYQHDLSGVEDWEVGYCSDPMISLSGDLFDFFVRQNKLSGLCIFDVSGHGLSSGLVTMMVKNTMEEEFYENEDFELDFTMQRINERVTAEKGNIENYLTGIVLRLTGKNVEMVNAGHPNPIIYHAATNTCEYYKCALEDRQGAIGLSDIPFNFKTLEINLEVNDRIILYTDGVTEAKDSLNTEYGKTRFLASVQAHSKLGVNEQIAAVVSDIKQFIGSAPRSDDISIVIIEKK